MRRVHVNGILTLMDYCTPARSSPAAASSPTRSSPAASSSTARSSSTWSGTAASAAGRTASGTRSSPASRARPPQSLPETRRTRRSTRTRSSREKPYLYVDANGQLQRLRPGAAANSSGTTWANGQTPGTSIPIDELLHRQADRQRRRRSTTRCAQGKNLHLHAGRLRRRPDDQGEAAGHGRARPRHRDARPRRTASSR